MVEGKKPDQTQLKTKMRVKISVLQYDMRVIMLIQFLKNQNNYNNNTNINNNRHNNRIKVGKCPQI